MIRCLLPAVALVFWVLAVLGPAVAAGLLLAPGDGLAYYFPTRMLGAGAWHMGEAPFWNPFSFGGMPLLAGLQGGFFYPGNWAFAWLPAPMAMNVTVALAYVTAGLAMYAFARALGHVRFGALVAALVWMTSGFMIAHLEHVSMIQGAALLPALLWAIERFRQSRDQRFAIAGGLVLALQILAGHPTVVAFSLLLAGPFAAWRAFGTPESAGWRLAYARGLVGLMALGVGLALVQLLPTSHLIAESQRQGFTHAQLVAEALPVRELPSLWFPFLFGAPPSAWFSVPPWGSGPWFNERVGYVGIATLALSAIAALGWRREPAVRFWVIATVVALALATGGATPLYDVWAQLPVLKSLRAPGRHLLEVDFALAVLAGYGMSALSTGMVSLRRAVAGWVLIGLPLLTVVATIAIAGAAIAGRLQPVMPLGVDLTRALSPAYAAVWLPALWWLLAGVTVAAVSRWSTPWWRAGLVVVLAADLWVFAQAQGWRQLSPPANAFGARLAWPGSAERTLVVTASGYPYYEPERALALGAPGCTLPAGERTTGGYDAFIQSRYAVLMGEMTSGGVIQNDALWRTDHHGLDLLATRWLRLDATLASLPAWRERLVPPRWRRAADSPIVAHYENTRALPRAWRPARVTVLPSVAIDARVTGHVPFAPLDEALLDTSVSARAWTTGPAELETPSPNRLVVTTTGTGPGLVVVSETYDAGWRAWAGEREVPVHRVNGLLIGVETPAGPQTLTLRYEPPRWRAGLAGSATAAIMGLMWWWKIRRRRSGTHTP
jgi:hypothetical protein